LTKIGIDNCIIPYGEGEKADIDNCIVKNGFGNLDKEGGKNGLEQAEKVYKNHGDRSFIPGSKI